MTKTLIHLSSSPYANLACKEGLDLALVLATFEQEVAICVSGAALSLLHSQQKPTKQDGKNLHKLLDGLEFYDIDKVYALASQNAADEQGFWPQSILLNDQEWQDLFTQYQQIYRF
ncbi:DsrE family protein [Marinomonas sp. THO17]|uniref:DsrE family protein n=1 Tax=Marinomonas sp. THO17 TaxID=3149048 RepID=UPI00336C1AB1